MEGVVYFVATSIATAIGVVVGTLTTHALKNSLNGIADAQEDYEAVIIYGPQGCGKTQYALALAKYFDCARIVDDFVMGERLVPGALHLTSDPEFKERKLYRPPYSRNPHPVHQFTDALRMAGVEGHNGMRCHCGTAKLRAPYTRQAKCPVCEAVGSSISSPLSQTDKSPARAPVAPDHQTEFAPPSQPDQDHQRS